MRKSIAATAIIAAAAATASCGFHRGGDSGPTVSRDYPVGAFQKIEVAGPYDVEVRTGANPSVAGKGSEKLLEQTRVEVHGDTLSISPDNHKGWFHMGWHPRQGALRRDRAAASRRDHRRIGRHQGRPGDRRFVRGHGRRIGRHCCSPRPRSSR